MVKKSQSQTLFWLQGCLHRTCPQVGGAAWHEVVKHSLGGAMSGHEAWRHCHRHFHKAQQEGLREERDRNTVVCVWCDGEGGLSKGTERERAVFSHRGHRLALNLVAVHWSGHGNWFTLQKRKVEGKVWAHVCPYPCQASLKSQAWLHTNVIKKPKGSFYTKEKTEDWEGTWGWTRVLQLNAHTADVCSGVTGMDEEQKWEETTQFSALRSQWPERVASREKERHEQMSRNSVVFFQSPLCLCPLRVSSEKSVGAFHGWKWGSWVQLLLEHWNPSPITQYLGRKICSCETHSRHFESSSEKRKCESNPTPENGSCINREKWEILSLILDWAAGLDLALCCLWGNLNPDFKPQYKHVLLSFNVWAWAWHLESEPFSYEPRKLCSHSGWMNPRKSIYSVGLLRKHHQSTKEGIL